MSLAKSQLAAEVAHAARRSGRRARRCGAGGGCTAAGLNQSLVTGPVVAVRRAVEVHERARAAACRWPTHAARQSASGPSTDRAVFSQRVVVAGHGEHVGVAGQHPERRVARRRRRQHGLGAADLRHLLVPRLHVGPACRPGGTARRRRLLPGARSSARTVPVGTGTVTPRVEGEPWQMWCGPQAARTCPRSTTRSPSTRPRPPSSPRTGTSSSAASASPDEAAAYRPIIEAAAIENAWNKDQPAEAGSYASLFLQSVQPVARRRADRPLRARPAVRRRGRRAPRRRARAPLPRPGAVQGARRRPHAVAPGPATTGRSTPTARSRCGCRSSTCPTEVGSMTFATRQPPPRRPRRDRHRQGVRPALRRASSTSGRPDPHPRRPAAGDATFHGGWTLHSAGRNPSDQLRT